MLYHSLNDVVRSREPMSPIRHRPPSFLRRSATERLLVALAGTLILWTAVFWAIGA